MASYLKQCQPLYTVANCNWLVTALTISASASNVAPLPPSFANLYIRPLSSSGRDHQPSMHDPNDKTDMDPRGIGSRKPPGDKMTAKNAGPASKETKGKRTKSTDKKPVSCSMNLHRHLVILTFEGHLCDILGRNTVNGLTVHNEVAEKLRSMVRLLRHATKSVGYVTYCLYLD
jgi:hypothetical protein